MADFPALTPSLTPWDLVLDSKGSASVQFDPALCNQCMDSSIDPTDATLYSGESASNEAVEALPHPVDGGDPDTQYGWAALLRPLTVPVDSVTSDLDEAYRDLFAASASGRMLDMHGERIVFPRAPYETDDCYRSRIIQFEGLRRDTYEFSIPTIAGSGVVVRTTETVSRLRGTVRAVSQVILEALPFVQLARVRCGDDLLSWTIFADPTAFPEEDTAYRKFITAGDEDLNIWIFGESARTALLVIDLWRHAVTAWTNGEKLHVERLVKQHFVEAYAAAVIRYHTASEGVA